MSIRGWVRHFFTGLPPDAQVIRLEPKCGDTLLLLTSESLSDLTAQRLRHDFETHLPGARCIVLSGADWKVALLGKFEPDSITRVEPLQPWPRA